MSINVFNNDKTLGKISSNNNINKHDRGEYIGRTDTLWIGTTSGNTEIPLNHPIEDYDYIDIEFTANNWLLFDSVRYTCDSILKTNSSNMCRFYLASSLYFSFYIRENTKYIKFHEGTMNIKKIIGVKRKEVLTTSTFDGIVEEYSNNILLTNKVYDSNAVFRKVIDYTITSDKTSTFTIYHYLNSKYIIDCECSIIYPNGDVRVLPTLDEQGNSISFICYLSSISVIIKNMTIEKDSIIRIILDYSL